MTLCRDLMDTGLNPGTQQRVFYQSFYTSEISYNDISTPIQTRCANKIGQKMTTGKEDHISITIKADLSYLVFLCYPLAMMSSLCFGLYDLLMLTR